MKPLKPAYAAAILLVGLGSTFTALATSTCPQELGEAAFTIDVFKFTCPPKTVSARAKVEDINPPNNKPALMRVKLVKDHYAALAQDLTPSLSSGEGSASLCPSPSPNAMLAKGPGVYLALFYKTAAGEEKYRGSVVCESSDDSVHDPVLIKTQDEGAGRYTDLRKTAGGAERYVGQAACVNAAGERGNGPKGNQRVIRGGSWNNRPRNVSSTNRNGNEAQNDFDQGPDRWRK